MKKPILLLAALFYIYAVQAATKTVVSNLDQSSNKGWQNPNNWNPIGVPQSGDIVIVPSGKTISVKGNVYSTVAANLTINVYGTLDFDPSGTLNLSSVSVVQLFTTAAKITTNGSSSEQIIIGNKIKYNGQTDGTVSGPAFTSFASPNSTAGQPGAGFILGVLPVTLSRFDVQATDRLVHLQWTTELETNLRQFDVQRSANGREWQTIKTVRPQNTCGCTTQYSFSDSTPAAGHNYYRLYMLDNDGTARFSKIVDAPLAETGTQHIRWQFEKGSSKFTLLLDAVMFPAQVQVFTASGQQLQHLRATTATVVLQVPALQSQTGVVILTGADNKMTATKIAGY